MATLEYGSTDFTSTLGGLPQISRTIDRELDASNFTIVKEIHTIRLIWNAVPTADQDINLNQDDLAEFEALILGLTDDLPLVFDRNDGEAYWAYDSTAAPVVDSNNIRSIYGLKITKKDFPWGPAKAVTNAPVVVEFKAEVQPCLNEPVNGVGSLLCSIKEDWDLGGIKAISYSGRVCACLDEDVEMVFQDLLDSFFTPDAIQRFTEAGLSPGNSFRPTTISTTLLDKEDHCMSFTIGFDIGHGGTDPSIVSESLDVQATASIEQNLVTLVITATYEYRGGFSGAPASTFWPIFAHTTGGPSPAGGSIKVGAGKTGGGGSGTFDQVWKEAFQFQGVIPSMFLPAGAGTIYLTTDPELSVNTATNVITSKKTFFANWIHDDSIVLMNETVSIGNSRPGISQRRMMLIPGTDPIDTLAYIQESGSDVFVVTFTTEVTARRGYYELPDRIPEDRTNVWKVSAETKTGKGAMPNQIPPGMATTGSGNPGHTVSTVTQTFWVRDMAALGSGGRTPSFKVLCVQDLGASSAPYVASGSQTPGRIY